MGPVPTHSPASQWEPDQEAMRAHPLRAGQRWVIEAARIRCNATGEVRETRGPAILEEGCDAPSEFIWSDGNYACDCNRRIFFERAAGNEVEGECGDSAYSVEVFNPKTSVVFYSELESTPE